MIDDDDTKTRLEKVINESRETQHTNSTGCGANQSINHKNNNGHRNPWLTGVLSLIVGTFGQTSVYPDVSSSYLGAGDPGVSYLPSYLGLKLHLRCYSNVTTANQNGPIALFDAGLPFFSTAWVSVIPAVLTNMPAWNISKACFMDRYGYGWSDASLYPITTQDYVFRLHGSLQVAGLTGKKYVLVGWSWGSIFVQAFSLAYPKEVVGILTADGTDSRWGFISSNQQAIITYTNTYTNLMTQNSMDTLEPRCRNGEIGLGYGWFPDPLVSAGYTSESIVSSQDIFLTNKYLKTAIQEYNIMVISSALLNFTYVLKGSTLKDLPYVNIYEAYDPDWQSRQLYMTSLSSNSAAYLYTTDHFFPFTNSPAIVSGLTALTQRIATTPGVLWANGF
ncbi:hypothetical protein DFA_08379 [Cavenderia fasciculata]|uniref:AB hydrolase-1 domain-containing protein n=1 Tax=Cavenderia fasciculata TaxID=261658 RepID=F4Q5X5_CACFS|nr:uncharacterized protein DFA_08379 [Cavenderia fasciculata]EGG17384.1 hypothetical protein DFA_08379 [Cavenderia fasciculata]|eukprot:XP_004355868.1 hypothetical protein DFA_08379 [Cavenderia fasciculata]